MQNIIAFRPNLVTHQVEALDSGLVALDQTLLEDCNFSVQLLHARLPSGRQCCLENAWLWEIYADVVELLRESRDPVDVWTRNRSGGIPAGTEAERGAVKHVRSAMCHAHSAVRL